MDDKKVTQACDVIGAVLSQYRNPVLLCSFGKDSMVLLYMLRKWFQEVPIVFFKQSHFPRKYAYANRVIEDWNLQDVHTDIPPVGISIAHGHGKTEITNHYPYGGVTIAVPIGWLKPNGASKYLCGRDDLLNRSVGSYNWPWDCALHGHKATDTDPIYKDLHIDVDISQNQGGCDTAFPLRNWTDQDIWDFTELHDIPINNARYEKVDGQWRNKPDQLFDSDYFPYCNKCLDPLEEDAVLCPKSGLMVENLKHKVHYRNHTAEVGYVGKTLEAAHG